MHQVSITLLAEFGCHVAECLDCEWHTEAADDHTEQQARRAATDHQAYRAEVADAA